MTHIATDGKKANLNAYERKMARGRPAFLNQSTLDYVAKDHGDYLVELGKKSRSK